MTIRDAVIACFRVLGMDFSAIALAYKLPRSTVEEIVREAVTGKNGKRRRRR